MKNQPAWHKISNYFQEIKDKKITDFFNDNRLDETTFNLNNIYFDFSKNKFDDKILKLFVEYAKSINFQDIVNEMFTGKKINFTENRAVLHTALRQQTDKPIFVDNTNIIDEINQTNQRIQAFTENVISGKWKGITGKSITDVINIGIGGSELGPKMVVHALKAYRNHLNIHYLSNIDPNQIDDLLKKLNLETSLFIIVSKSFSTQETLTNAKSIQQVYIEKFGKEAIAKHFASVSTQVEKTEVFGIKKENVFPMWDWVGGRYSLWSPAGISIPMAIGFDNFKKLLKGANLLDEHYKNTELSKNIPFISSLISLIYNNLFEYETETYIPYTEKLKYLPDFLQQLMMESNGKYIDNEGKKVNYQTGNIVWGNVGTNAQHSFFQLLHQGTKVVPVHFIGEKINHSTKFPEQHSILLSNMIAQSEALMIGDKNENPYKNFEGNRPSTTIFIDEITPATLGSLIAYYEHVTFTQGIFWNINSFDQFGVELGKKLANKILSEINTNNLDTKHDASTQKLIALIKKQYNF